MHINLLTTVIATFRSRYGKWPERAEIESDSRYYNFRLLVLNF